MRTRDETDGIARLEVAHMQIMGFQGKLWNFYILMQSSVFPGLMSGTLVNDNGLYLHCIYFAPIFKKDTLTKILLKQNALLKIHRNIHPSFCKPQLVKMFTVESVL
uniref:Uncharacterized protein n=1 Tax=Micrurus spixii TaxID=129469 RepID=A0A2D4M6U4_9SAUR